MNKHINFINKVKNGEYNNNRQGVFTKGRKVFYMSATANIGCVPVGKGNEENRHSHNFNIIQLPKKGRLLWRVITNTGENGDICFNVKEHYTYKEDKLRYENMKNGMITEYAPYRNLYIADVQNANQHFVVQVEAVE